MLRSLLLAAAIAATLPLHAGLARPEQSQHSPADAKTGATTTPATASAKVSARPPAVAPSASGSSSTPASPQSSGSSVAPENFTGTPVTEATALTSPIATILCYHEVDSPSTGQTRIPRRTAVGDKQTEMNRYTVTPENFAQQLDYLQSNHYHVIPLRQLVDFLTGRSKSLPARAVVITVDDGWHCTSTDMQQAFASRGMPWTLFIYPSIVGHGLHALNWLETRAMSRKGVDVESHSFSHPFLTLKNNPAVTVANYETFLEHELIDSKATIEKQIGKPVRYLCYPFGDYDETVVAEAMKAGYEAGLTVERAPITRATPVMKLKRYLLHNDTTLEEFRTFLLP